MSKIITITLTDAQVKALEHDILDIDQWVQDAVTGRINYSLSALANDARDVLMADPTVVTMPAQSEALIAEYMARPDYKNRAKRDADAAASTAKPD